jgi:hypothetical protein
VIVMNVYDMHDQLSRLQAEHRDAIDAGDTDHTRELGDDLSAAREAYVGLAVTAIASLRGELFGAQQG